MRRRCCRRAPARPCRPWRQGSSAPGAVVSRPHDRARAAGRLQSRAIPFSGPARKALELTFREALRLGHNYIGTEHLLLALLELEDGPLRESGIDNERLETDLIATLESLTRNS